MEYRQELRKSILAAVDAANKARTEGSVPYAFVLGYLMQEADMPQNERDRIADDLYGSRLSEVGC